MNKRVTFLKKLQCFVGSGGRETQILIGSPAGALTESISCRKRIYIYYRGISDKGLEFGRHPAGKGADFQRINRSPLIVWKFLDQPK